MADAEAPRKKVCIISTSAGKMGDHTTGVWLEELAAPYYLFSEKCDVTIASIKGGAIPIDAGSMAEGFFTEKAKQFMHDAAAMNQFCHSMPLGEVKVEDFDAIFLPGGHGTCEDFVDNAVLEGVIRGMMEADKVVSAVCHGPMALCGEDVQDLINGKSVTGFKDSEEEQVGLTEKVPFLLEETLRKRGADYKCSSDWHSYVAVDGKLVTGQNPQSSEAAAKKVLELLD